jgi:hypothetical protein
MFSHIAARRESTRWVCDGRPVTKKETAWFVEEMRLFYMKDECMSIHSMCTFIEMNVANEHVQLFFRHMRESWKEDLGRSALLLEGYSGQIRTNKDLIDAVLYSGRFHSQEKYKRRYNDLLAYMDESLILMSAYNAMHSGYHMNQISRALSDLREDNLIVLLPDHLRHEWDKNCPYKVIR